MFDVNLNILNTVDCSKSIIYYEVYRLYTEMLYIYLLIYLENIVFMRR